MKTALLFGVLGMLVAVSVLVEFAGAPALPPGKAQIVIDHGHFTPRGVEARVGQPVTIVVVNRSTERHDVNFASLHMPGIAGAQTIVEAGEARTLDLVFDRPGTHTFSCSNTRDAVAGMSGAVFVRP